MDLLYQAAQAWKDLTQYTYCITYGQNKTLHTITLKFRTDEFYHLAGFQYTKDVVLPVFNIVQCAIAFWKKWQQLERFCSKVQPKY